MIVAKQVVNNKSIYHLHIPIPPIKPNLLCNMYFYVSLLQVGSFEQNLLTYYHQVNQIEFWKNYIPLFPILCCVYQFQR